MEQEKNMKNKVIRTDDLVADLRKICYENTTGYRSDFDIDEKIILSEATKPAGEREALLWMSHPNGTHIFLESEVYLEGSPANRTWLFYDSQLKEAKKIAYAIWIDDFLDEKVVGVLYELDFEEHCRMLKKKMVPSDYVRYIYEKGSIECSVSRNHHSIERNKETLGELLGCRYLPNNVKKHLILVATEQLCRDGSKVQLGIELKEKLECLWKEELKKHERGEQLFCLRCGSPLDSKLALNAKSRYADVYICSDCGIDEALREYPKSIEGPKNFKEWEVYRQMIPMEKKYLKGPENKILLISDCEFGDVFKEKDPRTGRPVSETGYSRSYYDGYRWNRAWFLKGEDLRESLVKEMEGFQDALLAMPEFSNLYSLKRACSGAELTSNLTEFNLYSETYHFYIWIRLITRPNDHNLYVYYYRKSETSDNGEQTDER